VNTSSVKNMKSAANYENFFKIRSSLERFMYIGEVCLSQVNVKVNVDFYSALSLRYDTRSQGISQFYLQTPRSSATE